MQANTDELANCEAEQTVEIGPGECYPRTCPACGQLVKETKLPVHLRRYCEGEI